jgi:hypothetical protein
MAMTARRTGKPLRLFEIGSSAGLILRLDRYWYAADGGHWGDPSSAVRFDRDTYARPPPLDAMTEVVERRGCDLHPIDATTIDGQRRLLSYVWPDQDARLARLRAALSIASGVPVTIDRSSADDWVAERVQPAAGTTTVLLHSIMWQYLPSEVQERVTETLNARGAATTSDAPLAWVRLEPAPKIVFADVRVTLWPGGVEEVVATSGFHGPPVRWLAD